MRDRLRHRIEYDLKYIIIFKHIINNIVIIILLYYIVGNPWLLILSSEPLYCGNIKWIDVYDE